MRKVLSPIVLAASVLSSLGMLYVLFNIYSYSSSTAPPPADLPTGVIAFDGRFVLGTDLPGLMIWAGYGAVIVASGVALLLAGGTTAPAGSRRNRLLPTVAPTRSPRRQLLAASLASAIPVLVLYLVTVVGAVAVAALWGVAAGTTPSFWLLMLWMAGRGLTLAIVVASLLASLARAVQGAAAALTLALVYLLVIEPLLRGTVNGYRFLLLENVKVWLSLPGDPSAQGLRDIGVLGGPVLLAYAAVLAGLLFWLGRGRRVPSEQAAVTPGVAV